MTGSSGETGGGARTVPPPPDEDLVERALQGDEDAFAELVRRHQARVRAIAARFLGNAADVDELAQECFVQAYERLSEFRAEGPFEGWLCRIAVRLCYDQLRKRQRSAVQRSVELEPHELEQVLGSTDGSSAPAQRAEAADLARRLLDRLGAPERLVLTLQVVEGYDVREIAELTGWSRANVKVRAFRARRKALDIARQLDSAVPGGTTDREPGRGTR